MTAFNTPLRHFWIFGNGLPFDQGHCGVSGSGQWLPQMFCLCLPRWQSHKAWLSSKDIPLKTESKKPWKNTVQRSEPQSPAYSFLTPPSSETCIKTNLGKPSGLLKISVEEKPNNKLFYSLVWFPHTHTKNLQLHLFTLTRQYFANYIKFYEIKLVPADCKNLQSLPFWKFSCVSKPPNGLDAKWLLMQNDCWCKMTAECTTT